MEKGTTFTTSLNLDVEEAEIKEAFASLNYNKEFATPIRFVFTDSFANANAQRVPTEEFENVIKTGQNMPIKAIIEDGFFGGHSKAVPIGTITHLKKEKETVAGLGLLWKQERPEEVALVKQCYEQKIPINLSWELGYTDSSFDADGVEDLRGIIVQATTIVADPAYEGRTPVLAVAQKNSTTEDIKLEELQAKIDELTAENARLIEEASTKDTRISELETEMASLKTENEALASFKKDAEDKVARENKVAEIKQKFIEAGIQKDESYFTENMEQLLAFDDSELEFVLQNFVSFASSSKNDGTPKMEIPNIVENKTTVDPKKLGQELRNIRF